LGIGSTGSATAEIGTSSPYRMAAANGRFRWWVQRIVATLHSDDGMELNDEAATADILLGFPAGRDLGSMAAR
jgi:hypothetical protein